MGLAVVIWVHGCAEVCVDGVAGTGRACVGVLAYVCNMVLWSTLCATTQAFYVPVHMYTVDNNS